MREKSLHTIDFGNNIERAIEDVVYILRKYELEEEKNAILKKLEKTLQRYSK